MKSKTPLAAYLETHGSTKTFLCNRLGVSRFQLEGLLGSDGHQPPSAIFDVRADLADRVAKLLGHSVEYVRDFYRKVAA